MIEFCNVYKSFDSNCVLQNFSCIFKKEQINFITGQSGKGKTTIIRIILGLETIDKGTIKIADRLRFSVVFQENRLFEQMSIQDNVRYVTDKPVDMTVAEELGLIPYLGKPVNCLSGGTKRRTAIFRALMADYDVLIMDEPFTGLDDFIKAQVMDTVKNCSKGKTVIISTHDKYAIEYMGNGNNIIEVK